MSKSILVIDAPSTCIDCPCHFAYMSGQVWCGIKKCELQADDIQTYRPDWCPIREVPQKMEVPASGFMIDELYGYEKGYNDAIDDILKGGKNEMPGMR